MAQAGEVLSWQKISSTEGDFTGDLDSEDQFGTSVAKIGDLNGNGIPEVAIGSWDDDGGINHGAVWILFLDSSGSVDSFQKISDTQGGFTATLDDWDIFGNHVAGIGDVNQDGFFDLAVAATLDDDGGTNRGAIYILFLDSAGTVSSYQKISHTQGSLGVSLEDSDYFGSSLAVTDDWDGNGVNELIVGAVGDDDGGGPEAGAIYILFLDSLGTVNSTKKISQTQGGWNPPQFFATHQFGWASEYIGDLNHDGYPDIAVSPWTDTDSLVSLGGTYIIFLDSNFSVKQYQKISIKYGDFADSTWISGDKFGIGLANIGDQNGNGENELVVGVSLRNYFGVDAGGFYILFLDTLGKVDSSKFIGTGSEGFDAIVAAKDNFGYSLASLGDIDGNGKADLIVSAKGSDDGGLDQGSAWIIWLGDEPVCQGNLGCGVLDGYVYYDIDSSCSITIPDGEFETIQVTASNNQLIRYTRTDSNGYFSFELNPGNYEVEIPILTPDSCDSIYDVTINGGDTTNQDFFAMNGHCNLSITSINHQVVNSSICPNSGQPYVGPCYDPNNPNYVQICMNVANIGTGGNAMAVTQAVLQIQLGPGLLVQCLGTTTNPILPFAGQYCNQVTNTIVKGLQVGFNIPVNGTVQFCIIAEVIGLPPTGQTCYDVQAFLWASGGGAFPQTPPFAGVPCCLHPNNNCIASSGIHFMNTCIETNCSCDPNAKNVFPPGCGPLGYATNQVLTYRIDFENIGLGPAVDVIIRDTFDTDIDSNSITIDSSSHFISDTTLSGEIIIVTFDSIMLPSNAQFPDSGKGFVIISASPKPLLPNHTKIDNRAAIQFDNWDQLITNEVINTIFDDPEPTVTLNSPEVIYYGYGPEECDTLEANPGSGVPPYSWSWEPGTIADSLFYLVACPADTEVYIVQLTDSVLCFAWDTVELIVIDVRCGVALDSVIMCRGARPYCVDSSEVAFLLGLGYTLGPCGSPKRELFELDAALDNGFLIQVYPNPFDKEIIFELFSDFDLNISIELLNMEGIVVRDIYSGSIEKSNKYKLKYKPVGLSDGVYIYRVYSNNEIIKTSKVVLMKQ